MSFDLLSIARQAEVAQKAAPELAKLRKATDGFETIFLKKLFSQMRASVKETHIGDSFGKEIFDDMFNETMATAAAKSKTLGVGDMLYNQFAPRIVNSVASEEMRNRARAVALEKQGVKAPSDLSTTEHDLEGLGTARLPGDVVTLDPTGHAISRKP